MKTIFILALYFCFIMVNAGDRDKDTSDIILLPDCHTFYSGHELALTIKTNELSGKSLNWNFRYSGRTLASGQKVIPPKNEVTITLSLPKLNEGVIAKTEFTCQVAEKELKRTLYLFYPNPFVGHKEELKNLKINVWEPTDSEDLAKLLNEFSLPFVKISDPANMEGNILLVSGLDFEAFPGISEVLLKIVSSGKKVILIPPFSGVFSPFGVKLDSFKLAGNEMISEFDKKFDYENWNGKSINNLSLNLASLDDTAVVKVVKNSNGFSFCKICKGKGQLIMLTWNIFKGVKESPTPLYLFRDLLLND